MYMSYKLQVLGQKSNSYLDNINMFVGVCSLFLISCATSFSPRVIWMFSSSFIFLSSKFDGHGFESVWDWDRDCVEEKDISLFFFSFFAFFCFSIKVLLYLLSKHFFFSLFILSDFFFVRFLFFSTMFFQLFLSIM